MKLICVFVFAYVDCWFSHEEAHMIIKMHYNYDENTACLQCSLCAHLFCVRPKKQFADDTAQIKAHFRIAHGISCFHTASFETIVLFTYIISNKLVKQISIILFNEIVSFSNFWFDSHTNASYDNYL